MQKILISIFSFLLCLNVINASEVNLNSKRYILYNMNDSTIIDSKKEHERTNIASLTKIMTVIVSIENIKDFDKKITMTSSMVNVPRDIMAYGFKKGDKVTYRDLLYAAMLPSAADAIYGLEISISGSEKEFVKLMNNKVSELGLKNTKFSNGVGLYNKNNYSSAYDMAQILMYSLKNPTFKEVFSTRNYKMSNGKTVTSTLEYFTKKLNNNLSYIKGSKTGHIDESGFCFASIASINDVNYLFVSLNAPKSPQHIQDHVKEYTYFSKNYSYQEVVSPTDKLFTLEVNYSKEKEVDIYANNLTKLYLKNDFNKSDLVYEYDGKKEVSYFDNNKYLGHMVVKYNDEIVSEFDVYNNTKLHLDIMSYLKDFKHEFIVISIIFLVLIVLLIIKVKIAKF